MQREEQEVEVTEYIAQIVHEDRLLVLAYNIWGDHVHIIIACPEKEKSNIVRKLKGKATQYYKLHHNIDEEFHLWAQKYSWKLIENDHQMNNTINYIHYNRKKHGLSENRKLKTVIAGFVSDGMISS